MQTIYLASQSYRRRVLLREFFKLKVFAVNIDERSKKNERPKSYIKRITKEKWLKAQVRVANKKAYPLVTADTIVVFKNKILQKPSSRKSAERMLKSLSGKTHEVISAVAVGRSDQSKPQKLILSISKVSFRKLTLEELSRYLDSKEWQGKAGAYGIQGKASRFVAHLEGSLTSIVGLPLEETLKAIDLVPG